MKSLLVFLLLTVSCFGQASLGSRCKITTAASTDINCVMTGTVAGNLIFIMAGGTSGATLSVSDSSSDVYTAGPTVANNGKIALFYFPNGPGGNLTIHCKALASTTIHCEGLEFPNIPISGVLSASGSLAEGTNTSHSVATSGSVSQARVTAVACSLSWSNSTTFTAGNIGGVASAIDQQQTSTSGDSDFCESVLLTAASGTLTAAWTEAPTGTSEEAIIAFNTNGASGGPNVGFTGKVGLKGKVGIK